MQIIKTVFKIGLVFGLLTFLAKRGFLSFEATRSAFDHWQLITPVFIAMLLADLMGAVRWQWLLRAQNMVLSTWRMLQITWIGIFFNIALPGAVSGDLIKAFYVGKEVEGKRAAAFGSILFDRVVGLSALVLVSAGGAAANFSTFSESAVFHGIRILLLIAGAGVIVFYGFLFTVSEKHDPVLWVLDYLSRRIQAASSLMGVYQGLRYYHHHRLEVIRVLSLSVGIHIVVCLTFVGFAHAMGETGLPLSGIFLVVPLGLLVTAVPVLPGGVGTGHVAFGWLFQALGSQRGADLFTLSLIGKLISSALGGLVYLRFKAETPLSALSDSQNQLAPKPRPQRHPVLQDSKESP